VTFSSSLNCRFPVTIAKGEKRGGTGKGEKGRNWITKGESKEESTKNIHAQNNKKGGERSVRREMKEKGRGKREK